MGITQKNILYLLIGLTLCHSSCDKDPHEDKSKKTATKNTLFTLLNPEESGLLFNNKVQNSHDFNIFDFRNFYNGGGVAIGDINNDGLADVFLSANLGPNKLFLNKGDLKFEDISEQAGVVGDKPWSTGVAMADINADGFLDIYVSNSGNQEGQNSNNELYINNGDLTFSEKAQAYNLAETGFSTHATFFDYDKDGDLDAYILNNSNIPVSGLGNEGQREKRAENWLNIEKKHRGMGDLLMRNDGDTFNNVSNEAGIYGSLIGFGLGVVVTDINNDLWPDIYVSNDFFEHDYLYINNGDGSFRESIKDYTSHLSLSAMGVDISDINNDGLQDIFITDMLPEKEERVKAVMEFDGYNVYKRKQRNDFYQQFIQNTLQINNGNGTFSEVAYSAGVEATDWSWAGLLFDMDNDGYRDIYITNGINHDLTDLDFIDFYADQIGKSIKTGQLIAKDSIIEQMPITPLPNYAFRNTGDITFANKAEEWGLGLPSRSNGAAYGDLDNDGDLDLVVNNVNMEAFLYRNNTQEQLKPNYLKIKLEGTPQNAFAVGASVRLFAGAKQFYYEHIPSRGFQSSMEYGFTIGLGDIAAIDSLRVIWPDNKTQTVKAISSNQTLALSHADATITYTLPKIKERPTLLTEIQSKSEAHIENEHSDFDFEGLIAKQLSQEGPALAIGDVNGDGSEDVFIGGAKDQAGIIYTHSRQGFLNPKIQQSLKDDAFYEDTAAAFFDADGDGDLDLLVATGGNQINDKTSYIPRLYMNNGKGVFSKTAKSLPSAFHNMSVVAPYDFDADGDIDVFIGSRSVVGIYGVNPEHLFLENLGDGTFTNATEKLAYATKNAGMITHAIWEDINNDGKKDLITTSEWGTVRFYRNNGRRLSPMKTSLDNLDGWWNTIASADLDNDGDQDLIIGNEGTNLHYAPSEKSPLKLYINDFDGNGTIEQINTITENGKDYPLHQKKELTAQIVSLKKENLKASDYASRSIDELFSEEAINNAIIKQVAIAKSVVAINEGDGIFTIKPLPAQTQLSCICGIACTDINNDGNLDLIMGGNNFELKPQYSQLDASQGSVLLGDGSGNFDWQNYTTSGFAIRDEIKHLATFDDKAGNTFVIVAINNQKPKVYAY